MFRHVILVATATAALTAIPSGLAGAAPIDAASARGPVIHLGSTPYFPVMLIDQCTTEVVARARTLGINTILNEHCDDLSPRRQLTMIQKRSLAVLPIQARTVRGKGLIGWTYPDEPENNGWTPSSLKNAHPYLRGNADGLLSFVTTGGGFFHAPYRDSRVPLARYGEFARIADVAGFDLYPLGHCRSDLTAVYEAQRAFVRLAGSMPTFQWIETGPIKPTYCGGFRMTPAELRAEVWLAIAGGARGVGFFTHTWTPQHSAFDVSESLQHTMSRLTALLGAVRPGLLGRTMLSGVNSRAIKVLARVGENGKTYVFAVNTERVALNAKAHVPHLRDATMQVFGEKRTVKVHGAQFNDRFGSLAVHVYVQAAHAR